MNYLRQIDPQYKDINFPNINQINGKFETIELSGAFFFSILNGIID